MSAVDSLAVELKERYAGAPKRRQVLAIHLFGIEHADVLKTVSLPVLLERAGMSPSDGTELRKGIRLAEHVALKG